MTEDVFRKGNMDEEFIKQIAAMRKPGAVPAERLAWRAFFSHQTGVMEAMVARDAKYEANTANRAKSAQKKVDQRCIRTLVQLFNHINIEHDRFATEAPADVNEDDGDDVPLDVFVRNSLQEWEKLFLLCGEGQFHEVALALETIFKHTRPLMEAVAKTLKKNAEAREANRVKKLELERADKKKKPAPAKRKRDDDEDDEPEEDADAGEEEEEERGESPMPMDEDEEDGQEEEPISRAFLKRPAKKLLAASPTKTVKK